MYTVYILLTSGNTFYIGQTNNLEKRLKQHRAKNYRSAKYLRSFESFELVYTEAVANVSEALKREHQLRQLTHAQKQKLITTNRS